LARVKAQIAPAFADRGQNAGQQVAVIRHLHQHFANSPVANQAGGCRSLRSGSIQEFFGFLRVHEILMRASRLLADASADLELAESVFDSEYHAIIEDDSTIISAFERHLATNPQDFAPVR
jgi:hypothetical protein